MKKNAMLKIAAVLLVAVLLTTCAISSTFAKYVTAADDYTATARVAKWGITSKTTITGPLFAKTYESNKGTVGYASVDLPLMAPGTSGSVKIQNDIEGKSEVSGKIDYVGLCAIDMGTGSTVTAEQFFDRINLQYRINGEGDFQDVTSIDTLNNAINDLSADIVPNVSAAASKVIEIKWDWAFDDGIDNNAQENGLDAYDEFDVQIADKNNITLTIALTCDIYQTGEAGAAK